MARARRARVGAVAELQVRGLGPGQQPVECVPRLPALRAREAVRAGSGARRRVLLRRRRLTGVGKRARRLEQHRLAGAARAVRSAEERGGGFPRRSGAGDRRASQRRRLEHRDGDVARRRRRGHDSARPARPEDPSQRGRCRDVPGARECLPRAALRGIGQAHAPSRDRPSAGGRVHGRRPPRRLPAERRGPGRAPGASPRSGARGPVHGPEDLGRCCRCGTS